MKKAILIGSMLFILLFAAVLLLGSCVPEPITVPGSSGETSTPDMPDPASGQGGDNDAEWQHSWDTVFN